MNGSEHGPKTGEPKLVTPAAVELLFITQFETSRSCVSKARVRSRAKGARTSTGCVETELMRATRRLHLTRVRSWKTFRRNSFEAQCDARGGRLSCAAQNRLLPALYC